MNGQTKMKLSTRTVLVIILLVIALLSFFVVAKIVSTPEYNAATIESLNAKEGTVMGLIASALASSTAISLIPGDVGMPIANQIAELTSYFIIVLGVIFLEKMLIAVLGSIAFTYIIPLACGLGILALFIKKEVFGNLAIKVALFGMILFIAIPVGVKASDLIYESHRASVEQTIETANKNKDFIEDAKKDLFAEDKKWTEKIADSLSNLTSKIGVGISAMVDKCERTLSIFIDTIAVLIITTCVIPILVILIFAWLVKILFGIEFVVPDFQKKISTRNKSMLAKLHKVAEDVN